MRTMTTETINTDEYNGWTNRETWATALHLNNDQGLQAGAYQAIRVALESPTYEGRDEDLSAADALQEYVEGIWYDVLEDPNMRSRDLLMMFGDIGSTYRVDWREIGASFLRDVREADES